MRKNASVRLRAIFAAGLLSAAFPASADPVLPSGFHIRFSDESGKTWRQTGVIDGSLSDGLAAIRESFVGQGYSERYDIPDGTGERHVLLWSRSDEDVILMVWTTSDGTTGCSWGISPSSPDLALVADKTVADCDQTENTTEKHPENEDPKNEDKQPLAAESNPQPRTLPPVASADTNALDGASCDPGGDPDGCSDLRQGVRQ